MAVQSRIAPLPKVYCPHVDCWETCEWVQRVHGTEKDVIKCPVDGITGVLRPGRLLLPYIHSRHLTIDELKCIRCGRKQALAQCTFCLCRTCCCTLGLPCSARDHIRRGIAKYPHIPLREVQAFRLGCMVANDRTKLLVSVTHVWQATPVRAAWTAFYDAILYVRKSARSHVFFEDFDEDLLQALRIDGAGWDRLYISDTLREPAFTGSGRKRAISTTAGSTPVLALYFAATVRDLGRHDIELKAEEEDLSRDWDTLGTVDAFVTCYFKSHAAPRGPERIALPRRRLLLEDCTFTLRDFPAGFWESMGVAESRVGLGAGTTLRARPMGRENAVRVALPIDDIISCTRLARRWAVNNTFVDRAQ